MKYRKPVPGETIHCWVDSDKYISHKNMLYLGKDKQFDNCLLVQSKKEGFVFIDISSLPKDSYRPIGIINVESPVIDSKTNKYKSLEYKVFDQNKVYLIKLKISRGKWKISEDFVKPSWVEDSDARGTGSKEDGRPDEAAHIGPAD